MCYYPDLAARHTCQLESRPCATLDLQKFLALMVARAGLLVWPREPSGWVGSLLEMGGGLGWGGPYRGLLLQLIDLIPGLCRSLKKIP